MNYSALFLNYYVRVRLIKDWIRLGAPNDSKGLKNMKCYELLGMMVVHKLFTIVSSIATIRKGELHRKKVRAGASP